MEENNSQRSMNSNSSKKLLLHYPGQSLDKELEVIRIGKLGYIVILLMFVLVSVYEWMHYYGIPPQPRGISILTIVAGIYVYYKIKQLDVEYRNKKLGSEGEKEVGQILNELMKKGYAVFHDIVSRQPKFNIDHVVVSEHGIYAVETKKRSKHSAKSARDQKIVYNGKSIIIDGSQPDEKPIDQANANAKWLSENLLRSTGKLFPVQSVVLYPGWYVTNTSNDNFKGTWVLSPGQLPGFIAAQPKKMPLEDVNLVACRLSFLIRMNDEIS
jgi:hypothetical protein